MRITLAQTSPKLNRKNLKEIMEIVQEHQASSDLIVFPELALSGYMLQDKLYEDAWSEEELAPLAALSKDIDIAVGAAMRDGNLFRNAGLYFADGRLQATHIKVHLPNYGMFEEARYFEGGESFEVFEIKGKKISTLICEDLWHESVHQELIELNPDLIVVHVASPAREFQDNGLGIQQQWYKIIQTVAKETEAFVVFVNRVGFEDGLGFWGGSCIVNPQGEIVTKIENFTNSVKTVVVEDME